ncbi:MAG: 4-hydroxy-tetrahydrodipicolinate reductase [Pseudomonadota bacterium]
MKPKKEGIMSKLKLAISGAGGRMGGALIRAIDGNDNTELSGALEYAGSPLIGSDSGKNSGLDENGIAFSDNTDAVLAACDGVIDFTTPAATLNLAIKAGANKAFHIVGTTGFTANENSQLDEAARGATIVKSGNMSLGVNLLAVLVEQAAAALSQSDFDIEVLEMHHKHKVDAPSGTALLLGEAAAKGRGIELAESSVRSRDGITGAREEGTIGFATLRGGAVIGDHSVILASDHEHIELRHHAQDRSLFASGALKAALWAADKPAGLYSMRDVLGL